MKRISRNKGYSQIIVIGIMIIFAVIFYSICYVNNVRDELWDSSVNTIMESTSRAGKIISEKIDSEQSMLRRQKEALEAMVSSDADQIDAVMDLFDSDEYSIALVLDHAVYPMNRTYVFQNIPDEIGEDGEILAPYISENTGKRVIALVHKITFQDGVSGTLIREIAANSLNEAFSVSFLRNRGHSYLLGRNGDILFRSTTARGNKTSGNLFNILENEDENDKTEINEIAEIVSDGNSGWAVFSYNGENNLYYFSPVKSTDWYLVSVALEDELNEQTENILMRTFILAGIIVLGFVVLMGLLIYREHQNRKQLDAENTFEKQMLIEANSEVKTIILGVNPETDTYKMLSSSSEEERIQTAAETKFSELVSVFAG